MNRYLIVLFSMAFLSTPLMGCSKEAPAPAVADKPKADHKHKEGEGHGPHDGTLAKLSGGLGYAELKLHDDKGDLELWLAKDPKIVQPIDLPLDTTIEVTFADKGDKVAPLIVRNKEHNEDEDGAPNIRAGKTNYFIYPGDTGASSDWLKGKGFKSKVTIKFTMDGKTITTEALELTPHTH